MHTVTGGLRDTGTPTSQLDRWPLYWLLIANLGNNITNLAIPRFVLETTGSAGRAGLVAVATVASMAISMCVGGTLTDRMSHRQLTVISDVLTVVTVAAIPALYLIVGQTIEVLITPAVVGRSSTDPA